MTMTMDSLYQMASVVGSIVVLRTVWELFMIIIYPFFRKSKDVLQYGKWAIVTGSSDGIGKAWAFALAKRQMNLILISRTQVKLDIVKDEIKKEYPNVQIRTMAIDFAKFTTAVRTSINTMILEVGGDIGVLINNVGMSYDYPQYLDQLQDKTIDEMIAINLGSTMWMMKLVLPGMITQRRGAIINTSSASARISCPLLSLYSGVKKGIEQLSESVSYEYAPYGISIQCQSPLFVTSKMSKIRNASLFVPSPSTYVQYAIDDIGYATNSSPYVPHAISLFIYECIPNVFMSKIAMYMHMQVRKKALAKLAKTK